MGRFRLRLRATEINLPMGEVLIGRGPECFLRINEPMVSRRHARLRISPDRVLLEDLGSRNGSQVNGVGVSELVALTPGDLIAIGTQQFTLEYEEPSQREPTGQHEVRDFSSPSSSSGGLGNVPVAFGSAVSGPTITATAASFQNALSRESGRPGASSMSPQAPRGPSTMSPSGTRLPGSSISGSGSGANSGAASSFSGARSVPSGTQGTEAGVPLPQFSGSSSGPTSGGLVSSLGSGGYASLGSCSNCGAPQGDASVCPRCGQPYRSDFGDPATTSGRASSFQLFWGLSDKVLAMGRVDEAERMMGPRLEELLQRAEARDVPDEAAIGEALRRALRLAAATRRDRWFAFLFDYGRACNYRMPLVFIDEVYAHMFTCRPSVGPHIQGYVQSLAAEEPLILRLVALRKLCREG